MLLLALLLFGRTEDEKLGQNVTDMGLIPHLISCRYGATVCVLDDLLDLLELSCSCRISAKEFSRERVRKLGKKCPHFVGRRRAVLSALEDDEGDFVQIRSHDQLHPGRCGMTLTNKSLSTVIEPLMVPPVVVEGLDMMVCRGGSGAKREESEVMSMRWLLAIVSRYDDDVVACCHCCCTRVWGTTINL